MSFIKNKTPYESLKIGGVNTLINYIDKEVYFFYRNKYRSFILKKVITEHKREEQHVPSSLNSDLDIFKRYAKYYYREIKYIDVEPGYFYLAYNYPKTGYNRHEGFWTNEIEKIKL